MKKLPPLIKKMCAAVCDGCARNDSLTKDGQHKHHVQYLDGTKDIWHGRCGALEIKSAYARALKESK